VFIKALNPIILLSIIPNILYITLLLELIRAFIATSISARNIADIYLNAKLFCVTASITISLLFFNCIDANSNAKPFCLTAVKTT
jgi:uncharacterized membrane protein SirB2